MKRVADLVAAIRAAHPADPFFRDFESSLALNSLKRDYYASYERAFACLDAESWANLRTKAVDHFHESRRRRGKAPLFDQLNDAFAYRWLVNRGFSAVTILRECGKATQKSPDISFHGLGRKFACDVKTLGVSDDELDRRRAAPKYYDWSMFKVLHPTFFKKIDDAVAIGTKQIHTLSDRGLVFVLVHGDDYTSTFYREHRAHIARHLGGYKHIGVVVKFGVPGQRRLECTNSLRSHHAT